MMMVSKVPPSWVVKTFIKRGIKKKLSSLKIFRLFDEWNCLRSNENLDNHIGKSVERNFSRSFQRSARGVRNAISVAKGIFDQQWSRIWCFSNIKVNAWSMTIIKRVLKGYTLIENWLKIPNWFSSPLLWTSHIIFLGSRWGLRVVGKGGLEPYEVQWGNSVGKQKFIEYGAPGNWQAQ